MVRLRIRHRSGASSIPGRLFMTLFGLAFVGLGSTFVFFIARGFLRSVDTYGWTPAECVITASRVETISDEGETYRLLVEYRWVAFGREHTGNVLRPGYSGSSDVAETERLAARYATGSSVGCYVDPEHPESAILERPSLLSGLWVLFPLVFVGAGLLVLAMAWSRSRPFDTWRSASGTTPPPDASRALSKRVGSPLAPGCLVLFFSVFALVGGGTSLFFLIPASKVLKARTWTAVPCTIESSGVRSHSGDDSTTYSVEVRYHYEIEGKTYRGSRYQFLGGSSSGYDGKQEIVDRLPAGGEVTCFVNPQDPFDAVIERGFTPGYLITLVPLLFLCVGLGGMIFALRSVGRKPGRSWQPAAAAPAASLPMTGPSAGFHFAASDGPVTLEGRSSPVGRLLGTLFVAAFWNGITGVFLWQMIRGWRTGAGDGCLTLFLVPFVLIGLLLLVAVPHAFLALFNPRPVLSLSRAALPLGGSAELTWSFKGWPSRISRLKITLEGQESATYGRGKQSSTSHSVFHRQVLADVTDSLSIASGRATLSMPEETMHTFESNHHKVAWTLKVAGTLRYWPDVTEEIAVTATPPGASS